MNDWYVTVEDLETGEIVKRAGPFSERKAEKLFLALVDRTDLDRFCVSYDLKGDK